MDKEPIIITNASALKDAAKAVVARVKRNEGNISINGVLSEIASGLAGEARTWGAITEQPVYVSENVRLVKIFGRSRPNKKVKDRQSVNTAFEFVASPAVLSKPRMLELASLWKQGGYENRHNRSPVCRFAEKDIYEFELVCIADLLSALEHSRNPIFVDSAYRLLLDWGNPSQDSNSQYPLGFIEYGVRQVLFELSYRVPYDRDQQIHSILQTWSYLKLEIPGNDCGETWVKLVQCLGWLEH